ncbi:ROK family protein [Nocardia sp. NEAU-G5]|uniref:ROK family protein n=1 Tax=Nocardia albiluteola TaxID=2842303 RepID=A0ABS6B5E4_9NOCA|nr:ROK family transcriptional regulator [Nocardia albiluteola]MBU3062628.1 ROK family protein [Nocardia albiluteola]MBU3065538.1 ROK family protein [Nocardia albiluteola]
MNVARPDEVRRFNRASLLRLLHVGGPATRATLATELGLNRSTIKMLVDGLAGDGVVEERVPRLPQGAGRPSLLVLPQPQAVVVLAVDVQVEHAAIALVGLGGQILGRNSWNLRGRQRDPDEVVTHVAESAALLAQDLDLHPVAAGISVPGVVRRNDGLVYNASNLGWDEVPFGDRMGRVLGVPVVVGNDAELGALAEYVRGVGRGASDAVFVSADVGVGGGIIAQGGLLRGSAGYLGEIGHMTVNPSGRVCHCGNTGCWETEVGEHALRRALGLSETGARGAIVAELRELQRDSDSVARLGGYVDWLILGLVNVVNILGPELVVLGDLFAILPEAVVQRAQQEVRRRSMVSRAHGGVRIERSSLGPDLKLLGAAEAAFEDVLASV